MTSRIDTTIQDWPSIYMENSNQHDQLILPSKISPLDLAKYISALGNGEGGHILLGAYSKIGYGDGFENVDPSLIDKCKILVHGLKIEVEEASPIFQKVFLLTIPKCDSVAVANGSAYILKDGIPILISQREILEKLGLGLDSSLINMLSEQISKQSTTVSNLRTEVIEKGKLKNQVSGLLVGAFIGWLLSTFLNAIFFDMIVLLRETLNV